MKNIAVFVSGGGSNFKAIHHQIQKREIPGEIVLLRTMGDLPLPPLQ